MTNEPGILIDLNKPPTLEDLRAEYVQKMTEAEREIRKLGDPVQVLWLPLVLAELKAAFGLSPEENTLLTQIPHGANPAAIAQLKEQCHKNGIIVNKIELDPLQQCVRVYGKKP